MSCDPKHRREIEALLADELTPASALAARAHIGSCGACRQTYDALAPVLADIEGRIIPSTSANAMRAAVLAAAPARRRRPWGTVAVVAAAAGILLALFVGGGDPAAVIPRPAPVARGGALPEWGVHLFCVDASQQPPRVRAEAALGAPITCRRGDYLQFVYSARSDGHLAVFSTQDRDLRWYHHDDGSHDAPKAVERPLPGSVHLGDEHPPGGYRLHGVFAPTPLGRAAVERAMTDGGDLTKFGTVTTRLTVEE